MKTYRIVPQKNVRIALSGSSGSGNTTVCTLLAKTLSVPCINYTFKNIAKELGLTFEEVIEKARVSMDYDKMVDAKQIALAQQGSCVLGSRLAIWLLKSADIKIYLCASAAERARRVQKREGGDLAYITAFTRRRDASDTERYKKLYGIDNTDYAFADLIIDTEKYEPQAIVDQILEVLLEKKLIEVVHE